MVPHRIQTSRLYSLKMRYQNLSAFKVAMPFPGVLEVAMDRPRKLNAMNRAFWVELPRIMNEANTDATVRCIGRFFYFSFFFFDVPFVTTSDSP